MYPGSASACTLPPPGWRCPRGRATARRFLAFAGAQKHRHQQAGGGVMDVDWQKAAPIVTGIPSGQLLVTVHNIGRIADIQNHRGRRLQISRPCASALGCATQRSGHLLLWINATIAPVSKAALRAGVALLQPRSTTQDRQQNARTHAPAPCLRFRLARPPRLASLQSDQLLACSIPQPCPFPRASHAKPGSTGLPKAVPRNNWQSPPAAKTILPESDL